MSVFRQIYLDYRRYRATDDTLFGTLLAQGFWASSLYRVFRSVQERVHIRILRKALLLIGNLLSKVSEAVTGICIPFGCEIGDGLYIGHFGNIFFPSRGKLGRNCSLSQGVTMGVAGRGEDRGAPTIGDRVYIGPSAIVVGKITIGDDVVICAGAVVTRSVPPRAVVHGNPARVISYEGSFEYVLYDGMETDPARLESMAAAAAAGYPASKSQTPPPPTGDILAPAATNEPVAKAEKQTT